MPSKNGIDRQKGKSRPGWVASRMVDSQRWKAFGWTGPDGNERKCILIYKKRIIKAKKWTERTGSQRRVARSFWRLRSTRDDLATPLMIVLRVQPPFSSPVLSLYLPASGGLSSRLLTDLFPVSGVAPESQSPTSATCCQCSVGLPFFLPFFYLTFMLSRICLC